MSMKMIRILLLTVLFAAMTLITSSARAAIAPTSVTVGAQSNSLTFGTVGSVTFPITVAGSGSGTLTVSVSGLPAGATFSPASSATKTFTLTITSATTTPAVTSNSFTVTCTDNGSASGSGSLTINKQTPLVSTAFSGTAITFGQTLASSTPGGALTNSAGASVAGTFVFANTGIAPNAGSTNVSVIFTPSASTNYNNVTNTVTVTVNKRTPTLTLTASAITFGQTLANSSLSGSAATNAANGAAVSGTFNFVNTGIAPNAGSTNVSAFFTPTDAANYNNATNTVTVTVNQAGTALTVTSSINPSGFTTNVTFTATLPAAATGNVIFKTNGFALPSAPISSGTATATTTLLPRGTNTITAEYAGDGNYLGSTNSLAGGQVVTNRPPVAGNATYTRATGTGLFINIANLLTNVTQRAADHVVTLSSVGSGSQGATITISGSSIRYAPLPDHNANDSFTYTVSDGQGGTATGNVAVNHKSVTGQNSGAVTVTANSVTSRFAGVPGWTYYVQRSTNLSVGAGWVSINTNLVPSTGLITNVDNFTDLGAPPASAYYRIFLQ